MALLHALLDSGYQNLVLCHLNHGLRGADSNKDESFVRELAEKHQLPAEIVHSDINIRMTQNDESMELAARNARHSFFAACAQKYSCHELALAHHADDQAETILFNLLRGSGGLKGMLFYNQHTINDIQISFYRPLLEIPRSQINDYLADKKIPYREDLSNAEAVATRNRLRNEAIPLLNNIMSKDIRPLLTRSAEISRTSENALQNILLENQLEDPQGRLFLPKVEQLPPHLQRMALHNYFKHHSVPNIGCDLLERCLTLLSDPSISKVNLPGGRFFRRKEKRLFIDHNKN